MDYIAAFPEKLGDLVFAGSELTSKWFETYPVQSSWHRWWVYPLHSMMSFATIPFAALVSLIGFIAAGVLGFLSLYSEDEWYQKQANANWGVGLGCLLGIVALFIDAVFPCNSE